MKLQSLHLCVGENDGLWRSWWFNKYQISSVSEIPLDNLPQRRVFSAKAGFFEFNIWVISYGRRRIFVLHIEQIFLDISFWDAFDSFGFFGFTRGVAGEYKSRGWRVLFVPAFTFWGTPRILRPSSSSWPVWWSFRCLNWFWNTKLNKKTTYE